jgi:hypothetical protein
MVDLFAVPEGKFRLFPERSQWSMPRQAPNSIGELTLLGSRTCVI